MATMHNSRGGTSVEPAADLSQLPPLPPEMWRHVLGFLPPVYAGITRCACASWTRAIAAPDRDARDGACAAFAREGSVAMLDWAQRLGFPCDPAGVAIAAAGVGSTKPLEWLLAARRLPADLSEPAMEAARCGQRVALEWLLDAGAPPDRGLREAALSAPNACAFDALLARWTFVDAQALRSAGERWPARIDAWRHELLERGLDPWASAPVRGGRGARRRRRRKGLRRCRPLGGCGALRGADHNYWEPLLLLSAGGTESARPCKGGQQP